MNVFIVETSYKYERKILCEISLVYISQQVIIGFYVAGMKELGLAIFINWLST